MFPIEADGRRKSLETQAQDQIPIAFLPHHPPAAALSHYLPTRFRALALFGRRPAERVVRSVLPASENLHITGCEQVQQNRPYRLVGGTSIWAVQGRAERS